MTDLRIECPHCHQAFLLNETLAAPLVEETRRSFEAEFKRKEQTLEDRQKSFADEKRTVDKARASLEQERAAVAKQQTEIDDQVAAKLAEQRIVIEREAVEKSKLKFDASLAQHNREKADLEDAMKDKDKKLAEAQQAQTEAIRKQRELDTKIREADLNAEKRAGELVAPQLEKAKRDADEAAKFRIAEKEKTISDLQIKLQEAIQKAEQGSQQLQGEVQELDLERRLRDAFPRDTVVPVPKGQHGGDALHRVLSAHGQLCGTILYESKRTKNWSAGWTDKLKQDQRAAKADLALIVTQAMPDNIDSFGELDGVWITTPVLAIPVAALLRTVLTEASFARRATEGQQDKTALLYSYLTGPQFRQRVEALKDAFTTMQDDLATEKRVLLKQWAKREKQIERVMASTVGMYGELQAIAGTTLQEIDGLNLKALESSNPDGDE